MSQTNAIQVKSLYKTYTEGLFSGGFFKRKKFEALKDVSFDVARGEIFGLLGPNGAGKTTFLKILLGIIRKTAGEATLLGTSAGSREGRQQVGYLPEHLRMPSHLTGRSALHYYGRLSNLNAGQIADRSDELLKLVGLADRSKDRVKKYSKGMLQRLGLAQALLHKPKLLVLDEPTDGLDPRARAEMRDVIRNLKQDGVTVFLNSHILQEVELVCDRVAILDRGVLQYSGEVAKLGNFVSGRLSGSEMGQIKVDIQLKGDSQAIEKAFDTTWLTESGVQVIGNERAGEEQKMTAYFRDQDQIDEAVDRVRTHSVSLIGLNREKVTLEDAFLQLLDGGENEPS